MDLASLTSANQLALAQKPDPSCDLMAAIGQFSYRGFIEAKISGTAPFVMFSNHDDIVAQHYLFKGPDSFESKSLELWARLAARSRLALDVGAFTGIFSLAAVHASPTIKAIGFEPSLNTFARFVTNVLANGMGGRVGTVKVALGPEDGQLTLKHPAGIHCLGSEETLVDGRHASVWFEEQVRVMAGDQLEKHYTNNARDFVIEADLREIDLIKIDVEGFELQVLRGLKSTLQRNHPTMIIECLSLAQFDEVNGFLASFGYAWRFIDDHERGLHADRERFARAPRNVLFIYDRQLLSELEVR